MIFRRRRKPTWLKPPSTAKRDAARKVLHERVAHWSQVMEIAPKKVFIRNQKTRWGTASSLGNVSFNWRVADLPPHIQDYIVIHELAHLREMNHSPAFWKIVERYAPEYKKHRRWLRQHKVLMA
jgi:predicted metal-dependent hydrolase